MKRKHWTLTPWFAVFAAVMALMAFADYNYNPVLCYVEFGISVAAFAVVFFVSMRFRSYISQTVKGVIDHMGTADYEHLEKYKYPVAIVGPQGDIICCNARFRKAMCGGKSPEGEEMNSYLSGYEVLELKDSEGADVAVDGREYTVYCVSAGDGIICHFIENTYYKETVREYQATLPCVSVITFDNSEDFSNDSDEAYSEATLKVESALQKWAADYNALYKRISSNRYMIIFKESDVEKMAAAKFPILKEIRSITSNHHIATISAGLCRGCKSLKESELNARKALEMALGRGGDQIAVIKNNSYEFFGGTAAAAEKVSKVRMRVIANAISRVVADCDKVYIMGHRFSDLDCLGAAIGLQAIMEKSFKRYCKVVVNRETSMAGQLITYTEKAVETDIFVSPEEAIRGVTPRTLLIVVDTHLKSSLESEELFDRCKRVIVIDHHRKSVNYIENAIVFCHEPSASSSCEMCSEIISCLDDKALGYAQADALLAGIMLDTKNFVVKTGVRTFEAAAYLRKKGANTLNVKGLFSESIDTYREKVDIVCNANIYRGCAVSVSERQTVGIRMASAQAADEMLTIQGVNASFVIFQTGNRMNISARSYGKMNVQIIMEKLGGGGHQTMAAAQLENVTKELAYQKLLSVIDEVIDEQG